MYCMYSKREQYPIDPSCSYATPLLAVVVLTQFFLYRWWVVGRNERDYHRYMLVIVINNIVTLLTTPPLLHRLYYLFILLLLHAVFFFLSSSSFSSFCCLSCCLLLSLPSTAQVPMATEVLAYPFSTTRNSLGASFLWSAAHKVSQHLISRVVRVAPGTSSQ